MPLILHQRHHLIQSIISQLEHLMNMAILFLGKVFITPIFMVNGTRKVIATVANTFYLRHLTQHGTNLQFAFRTQATFRHLIQIIGNLQFHIITNILILFNAAEKLIEIIFIRCMKQVTYHTKHTAGTFSK